MAKKQGKIQGYFARISKGRPPTKLDSTLPMNATVSKLNEVAKEARAKRNEPVYRNWNIADNFDMLKAAVIDNMERGRGTKTEEDVAFEHGLPRTTLQRMTKLFKSICDDSPRLQVEQLTKDIVFPHPHRGGLEPLLTSNEVDVLNAAIVHRDEANNGMTRDEAIDLIMELSQISNRKKATNHFDYLVRKKRLKDVKNGGKTVKAQATTTKRGQIVVEQQLRWHGTVDEALQEQRRLNLPAEEFEHFQDHFFGNMDETCLMANADGEIRVLASAAKKKTEKATDDCRSSITSLRVGMTSGTQGPFTFLAKGLKMDKPSLNKILKERCPAGSSIAMSPSAYMTDEVYAKLVPQLCTGIREMPVIKDHPEWWVVLSLDGFGSHVNVHSAQKVFYDHRIFVIKEEGDTSHVNQAYDQFVAKKVSTQKLP